MELLPIEITFLCANMAATEQSRRLFYIKSVKAEFVKNYTKLAKSFVRIDIKNTVLWEGGRHWLNRFSLRLRQLKKYFQMRTFSFPAIPERELQFLPSFKQSVMKPQQLAAVWQPAMQQFNLSSGRKTGYEIPSAPLSCRPDNRSQPPPDPR